MKNLLVLWLTTLSLTLTAQSDIYNGKYSIKYEADNGDYHGYEMTLDPDGTFIFHSYSKISKGIPPEKYSYGKGNWRAEKNIVSFSTDKIIDLDETHSLDFSKTKARYVIRSLRDKSDRVVPTRLKFYQSDIFWVKGEELLKSE